MWHLWSASGQKQISKAQLKNQTEILRNNCTKIKAVIQGDPKSSRQRGLDELDFLGEAAIKSHLPQKSPKFAKRGEKVSMNAMQEQKKVKDVSALAPLETIPHCNAEANAMGECIIGQSLI